MTIVFNFIDKIFDQKWNLIFGLTIVSCILSYFFFDLRDLISEFLIVNTIYLNNFNGFYDWFGIYYYDGQHYTSQMGIHGYFFSLPLYFGFTASNIYIGILIFIVTLLFFYIIISTAIEIKFQISSLAALFFILVIILNPILIFNSGNLYWLYFMYFLPFYFSLKYYKKINNLKFYIILSFLFFIKFLINFEFSSTVVIMSLIPIALKSDYRYVSGIKRIFADSFRVFCASIISFSLVILLLLFQLSFHGDKSFSNFEKVAISYTPGTKKEPHFLKYENRIVQWNSLYKSIYPVNKTGDNMNSNWNNAIEGRNTYTGYSSLLKYIDFKSSKGIFYSCQFIFFMCSSFFLFCWFLIRFKTEHSYFFSLFISIFASLSWIFLMPLHFYLHSIYWRGISDIIFIFPFYVITGIFIGYFIEIKLKKNIFFKL